MEKEITNREIYELLLDMSARLKRVENKVNSIEEHVGRLDERLTMNEKVAKLFNAEVLEKVE